MLDLLTLLLLPVVGVVATLIAVQVHRCFVTPAGVIYVALLPIGFAQVLASFGAQRLLGELLPAFRFTGVALSACGAVALSFVVWQLGGRGLKPRLTSARGSEA